MGESCGIDFESIRNQIKNEEYSKVEQEILVRLKQEITLDDQMKLEQMLSEVYFLTSNYSKAVESSFDAMEKAKQLDNLEYISLISRILIGIYSRIEDKAKALYYGKIALRGYEQLGDKKQLGITHNSMGVTYMEREQSDKAREHFNLALKYEDSLDKGHIVTISMNLATLELEESQYEKSLMKYKQGLVMAKELQNKRLQTYIYKKMAKAHTHLDHYEDAKLLLEKALHIQEEFQDKHELSECYKQLSEIAEKQHDYMSALIYLKEYDLLREKLLKEENDQRIRQLEQKYEEKEKEIYLSQNRELKKLNEELSDAYEQIKALAQIDLLTQIFNRRGFLHQVELLETKCKCNNEGYAVLLLDIDDFKKINDTYGHQKGDEVLIKVANTLKNVVGENGIVGRWGGEEFIIFYPKSDLEDTIEMSEKIRLGLSKHPSMIEEGIPNPTVTIGISTSKLLSFYEHLDVADNHLYCGKSKGKNIVLYSA